MHALSPTPQTSLDRERTLESCIFEGTVRHRRLGDRPRAFRYGLYMMYLDLSELDEVFGARWFWSTRRPALAYMRRADYLGDPGLPLDAAVRQEVQQQSGLELTGPIRVLTHLRYFGYCTNPVTFYYCFEPDGRTLAAVVSQITNTPWGERRTHVLTERSNVGKGRVKRYRFAKDFHVSPFLDMDYEYDWRFTTPERRLTVHMENVRDGRVEMDATLMLERREISAASLARCLAAYPLMTAQVIGRIYFQALKLKLTGYRFFDHPDPAARIGGTTRG